MAVLKAASDGAAQACGGRRFQITAARYEKAFCEAVNRFWSILAVSLC